MFKKLKKIISKIDRSLFKKFGSDKSLKLLENIKEARTIFSYLNEIGEESKVRFVGGCVRKSLCGECSDDFDLATSLEPNEVKKKLNKNDVKVLDTGISYGTVTAVINKKKFEITTLRKDVSTDGRHAEVEFTRNWEQDASRRDFTINAIYADLDGRILDPLNGISDLQNGKIKFIGSPEKRIQEDYLRILRYFRFFAQYSETNCDQNTIQSIKKNIDGINKISKERIFDELKKILSLKNVYNLFKNNQSKEIILNIFPEFKYPERLDKISNLDQNLREKYDNFLILALLLVDQSNNHEYFCHKYKTSKSIENRLNNISKNLENLKNKQFYSEENIKKLIYLSDKYYVRDLLLFSTCINSKIKTLNVKKLLDYAEVCKIPKFPISGDYLKKHGYESGAKLGKVLKSLEEKWIADNFNLDEKVLKKIIK